MLDSKPKQWMLAKLYGFFKQKRQNMGAYCSKWRFLLGCLCKKQTAWSFFFGFFNLQYIFNQSVATSKLSQASKYMRDPTVPLNSTPVWEIRPSLFCENSVFIFLNVCPFYFDETFLKINILMERRWNAN